MRSRWGSCSPADGTIRLSERLQQMPDFVIDYVLTHELAHLVVADHSDRFWRLLATVPNLERARGYLEGWSAAQQADEAQGAGPTDPDVSVD